MKIPCFAASCILIVSLSVGHCFGQPKPLSDFKRTDFLPTLEHNFNKDRNSLYCASFLYTIDKLKTKLSCPINVDSALEDLALVIASTSHRNTLRDNEIKSEVKISYGMISVKANFQKSLPFKEELLPGSGFQFNAQDVSSFEWLGEPEEAIQILYYKNDNNFTLKLHPRDPEHEIILSMTDTIPASLSGMVTAINKNIDSGRREQKQENHKWKYAMTEYDIVVIPELELNIKTNYKSIEGKSILCNHNHYDIGRAEQQIAFYLNKKGAEIESSAISYVLFAEPVIDIENQVIPKKMLFNKPFFVMLRRTNSTFPYFCMWIANTNHMVH